jgi:hydroxymethylbilane synthase
MTLRIATRGSPLALWQAHFVADTLRTQAGVSVELVIVQTSGDRILDVPLSQLGGQGVFTKEVQRAVLDGRADLAVHSLKDLPTAPEEGLVLAAVPPRGATGDAFLSERYRHFDDLPLGARLATGSTRRRAQILHRRPDLNLVDLRGNVGTRLRKLTEEGYDGIVLAVAGLQRLGEADRVTETLDPAWMLPAVGQGALGLECRADDTATRAILRLLDDHPTHQAVTAERAMLHALGGGCQVPIAAAATVTDGEIQLRGAVLSGNGQRRVVATQSGPDEAPAALGVSVAAELRSAGASELINPGEPGASAPAF